MKFLLLAFIVAEFASILGCGKNCKEVQYYFKMTESFSPEKDSIAIGDTLWINASHSTVFQDSITKADIDFSNSSIGTNMRIFNLPDNSKSVIGAVYDFDFVVISGSEGGNDNIPTENKGFAFEEINNMYVLKIGLIVKKVGIYAISVGDDIGVIRKKSGCEKGYFNIINANNNPHLYYYINFFDGQPINEYTSTHAYCFKVY